MRRGRFNRHFHVSEDKKNWFPAEEFPELFEGMRSSRGGGGDDDEVFQGGGSPFDDDYDAPPAKIPGRGSGRASSFDDDDDDEDEDWEDDDEDWEDDDSYSGGAVGGLVDWIEANTKGLVLVLLIVLGGLGWFVFGRESFTQDKADLEQLIAVKSRVSTAYASGTDASAWEKLSEEVESELASMVSRLEDTASATDHIKQELLFTARDDIPRMFKELPKGSDEAERRTLLRFARIEDMITREVRINPDPGIGAAPPEQPQPVTQQPGAAVEAGTDPGQPAGVSTGIPGQPGTSPAPNAGNGGMQQQISSPPNNTAAPPASGAQKPGMSQPENSGAAPQPAVQPAGGVPGRPPATNGIN